MASVGTLCTTLLVQDGHPLLLSLHICRLQYFGRIIGSELDVEWLKNSLNSFLKVLQNGVLRIEMSELGKVSFSTRMVPSQGVLTWKYYLEEGSALSNLKRVERVGWNRDKNQHQVDVLVLHTKENLYLECCIGNLFIYKNATRQWYTPPLSKPILPGIMRSVLLSHAPQYGVLIHERAVSVQESDSLYLTNAVRGTVSLSNDGPQAQILQQILSDVDESLALEHFAWCLNQLNR